MNIIDKRNMDGLLEDEKNIYRLANSAVSTLSAQADLVLDMAAYLFTEVKDVDSFITQEYVDEITAEFQTIYQNLAPALEKLQVVESFGHPTDGDANLSDAITIYSLSPSTYTDRYK